VLRALIAAAVLTGVAVHFGAPPDAACGYAFTGCLAVWLLSPPVRRGADLVRRLRRRRGKGSSTVTTRAVQSPAPALTQINHYHYYAQPASLVTQSRPDIARPALPVQARQQILHNTVYDTIDGDA
jgi:hypothetical protein